MYKVLLDGIDYSISNLLEANLEFQRFDESGAFFWRKQMSDSIIFTGASYEYVKGQTDIDLCQKVDVQVFQFCSGVSELIYEGSFTRTDCKIYEDRCKIEVEVKTEDEYTCILTNWEKKYNILEESSSETEIEYKNPLKVEFLVQDAVLGPPAGYYSTGETLTLAPPCIPATVKGIWWRIVEVNRCVGGVPVPPPDSNSPWFLLNDTCNINGFATWYRQPVTVPVAIPNGNYDLVDPWFGAATPAVDYVSCSNIAFPGCVPVLPPDTTLISEETVTGCNIRYFFRNEIYENTSKLFVSGGRELLPVLQLLVDKDCPSLTVQSDLFTNAVNYVTGSTQNNLRALLLFQKSDWTNAGSSEQATLGEMSLKDLLEDLGKIFNIRWRIEGGNILRIEHVSFFAGTVNKDISNDPLNRLKNTYDYSKIEIPVEEIFDWANPATGIEFQGLPIRYDSNCTSSEVSEIRTSLFETEIEKIILNESAGTEGFVLMINGAQNEGDFYSENGRITGLFYPNAPLSWSALQEDYLTYDRPFKEGFINNNLTTFVAKKLRKQDDINWKECCVSDLESYIDDLIQTTQGEAEVQDLSYSLRTRTITANLNYDL